MRIIYTLDEMTETARGWLAGGTVGFIPAGGYLHEGHSKLIQASRSECEITVVSIFVNPFETTFRKQIMLNSYNSERDLQLLRAAQVDVVFIPRVEDLYPLSFSTYVRPTGSLIECLEELNGPSYSHEIATTIAKLFQLIRPDIAYFGQKDAQQIAIIRQVVRDLNIDIQLHIQPTVREANGLAVSSRNAVLSPQEREAASVIYRALLAARSSIDKGEFQVASIEQTMKNVMASEPDVKLESIAICHPDTFAVPDHIVPNTVLAIAASVRNVRLIDTIVWLSDGKWRL